ncbi:alpha/beta fold hydrolase [Butyrivibrio hungatei]|uniref:alpha/beta fold hydrolase n=1 Tax=Butyrivibrio hungatei TaxID=185008 RepID=UPI000429C097|nr:alpha/beta hydrolase [Butyrivibrio hungatei]
MEHKTINGAGGVVHYWISRPKETSKGAIVFTHGVTADHTMFEKQLEFFDKEYTVITWDVPLHGLSVDYRDFSFTNTAKDLNDILEQEAVESAALVGMSLGGYPSQMFAHMYPEKVQCFVALDTTPFGKRYYSKFDMWCLSKVKPMAGLFTDKALRKSMARSISLTDYSYNKMLEILAPMTKAQIIAQMDVAYGKFAQENRDIELKCPVLILLGDKDRTGKVMQYCKAWAENTGYPLHIIENASHFSNGDNAEQVNKEIAEFLDSLGRKGEHED